ncbi:hypothetical protein CPC08DRAFT_720637 [Agrocybe pediades]|nr:hypothetical protein CPC08DRAFT_720637 [Agrocybe pediades]
MERATPSYSKTERKVLYTQKEGYMKCTSAKERKAFVATKIQKLLSWIRNNWRLSQTQNGKPISLKVRSSTVIGQIFREKVEEEVKRLTEEARLQNKRSARIGTWAKALKNIRMKLGPEELKAVEEETQRQSKIGPNVEAKRKLRLRHWKTRLDEAAQRNFMEMDMLTFTFIVHRNQDGELEVCFHNKVAYLLGLPESFNMSPQAPRHIANFKNALSDYIVDLKKELARYAVMANGKVPTFRGISTELLGDLMTSIDHDAQFSGHIPTLEDIWYIDEDQYPMFKADCDPNKATKAQLEAVMRGGFSHIKEVMATGKERKAVPWEQIEGNETKFFDKQYLPKGFSFKPPRDMLKGDIVKFIHHIIRRQEQCKSSKDVFRFSMVTTGRVNASEIIPASYEALKDAQTTTKKTRKKKLAVPNAGCIMLRPNVDLDCVQIDRSIGPLGSIRHPSHWEGIIELGIQSHLGTTSQAIIDLSMQSGIDPNLGSQHTTSIDPTLDTQLTTTIDPNLDSQHTTSIDPTLDTQLTTTIDPTLDNQLTSAIDPNLDHQLTTAIDPNLGPHRLFKTVPTCFIDQQSDTQLIPPQNISQVVMNLAPTSIGPQGVTTNVHTHVLNPNTAIDPNLDHPTHLRNVTTSLIDPKIHVLLTNPRNITTAQMIIHRHLPTLDPQRMVSPTAVIDPKTSFGPNLDNPLTYLRSGEIPRNPSVTTMGPQDKGIIVPTSIDPDSDDPLVMKTPTIAAARQRPLPRKRKSGISMSSLARPQSAYMAEIYGDHGDHNAVNRTTTTDSVKQSNPKKMADERAIEEAAIFGASTAKRQRKPTAKSLLK